MLVVSPVDTTPSCKTFRNVSIQIYYSCMDLPCWATREWRMLADALLDIRTHFILSPITEKRMIQADSPLLLSKLLPSTNFKSRVGSENCKMTILLRTISDNRSYIYT